MRYTKEQLQKQYSILPEAVKEVVGSTDFYSTMIEIGKKYNLHTDQVNKLIEELSYVMYGLTKPIDFADNLHRYLAVSEDQANLITFDINERIFSKIRKELTELYNGIRPNEKETQTPVAKTEPAQTASGVFQQKMSGTFSVPQEKVEVKAEVSDNNTIKPAFDPYREQF